MIIGYDMNSVMRSIAREIQYASMRVGPRSLETKEITNAQILLTDPEMCVCTLKARGEILPYLVGELNWYFEGGFDADEIGKYSNFWFKIADPDGKVNSNYGQMAFKELMPNSMTQFEWCLEKLKYDKDSRQAVINFNDRSHKYNDNKDFVCTMFAQFLIRRNELHMYVFMRSQDLILGFTYDIPFFCLIQQMLLKKLKLTYPDLRMGAYHHQAISLHVYANKYDMLEKIAQEDPMPMSKSLSDIGYYDVKLCD